MNKLRLIPGLMVSLTALTVVAMGALMTWNLRNGFGTYLVERDRQQLQAFARYVAERTAEAGGAQALLQGGLPLHRLAQDFQRPVGGAPPPPALGEGPGPPPPGRPPPPRSGLADRITLHDLQGRLLAGRPPRHADDPHDEVTVLLQQQPIALLRLQRVPAPSQGLEADFLGDQYQSIVTLGTVLLLLANVSAYVLTRKLQRPLLAVQDATSRIAAGERDVRIDRRLQSPDEIGDVIRNVNHMSDSLQRMGDARRRWVADIAHELRTPLAVLQGEIEALLDGIRPLNSAALHSLREEAQRLAGIVNDLHQLSLADLGALPCQPCDDDAAVLLRTVAARFELPARQRGLDLQVQAPVPLPVHWDPRRIEQLLGNLVSNSLRYTNAPGQILLQAQRHRDDLVLTIDDSAPGVPDGDLAHLFEPLFRTDTARSREQGGSGLGLAICQAIAQAHGAHLQADASPLGGLRITLTLPLRPATGPA